ncbi:MAG: hypothetical protein AVDCRST_MAG26-4316 [uncultured Chloroflexia bacterium]|uniref:Uncharacterized protein n=1 Tax=uncultured Chloroflexia bacterium TaxID=1672391 RepID=A0A6J4K2J7_9CHLR|nr:MAG: hypothetical protein AVDCRST_MAG26-4316 [uncultured Chloroflexia bacterium]
MCLIVERSLRQISVGWCFNKDSALAVVIQVIEADGRLLDDNFRINVSGFPILKIIETHQRDRVLPSLCFNAEPLSTHSFPPSNFHPWNGAWPVRPV